MACDDVGLDSSLVWNMSLGAGILLGCIWIACAMHGGDSFFLAFGITVAYAVARLGTYD